MKILKYIILGLIQGLTEPLPISSSAHMIFISHYLEIDGVNLSCEIFFNFASFLAILIFFLKDILTLLSNSIKNKQSYLGRSYFFKLLLASIPACFLGLLFNEYIELHFVNFFTSSVFIIFTSLFLFYTFWILKTHGFDEFITFKSALLIGFFQGLALIPGLSRSGLTLCGGVSNNVSIKKTLQFSFFLYLIASFGATVLAFLKIDLTSFEFIPLLFGMIFTFISTYVSIYFFYNKLTRNKILFFAIYCLTLGIFNLISFFA